MASMEGTGLTFFRGLKWRSGIGMGLMTHRAIRFFRRDYVRGLITLGMAILFQLLMVAVTALDSRALSLDIAPVLFLAIPGIHADHDDPDILQRDWSP